MGERGKIFPIVDQYEWARCIMYDVYFQSENEERNFMHTIQLNISAVSTSHTYVQEIPPKKRSSRIKHNSLP